MGSQPLEIKRVRIEDPFWKSKQELIRSEVIPYQWEVLNDRVPEAEPSYCMHNFRAAAKIVEQAREAKETGKAFEAPKYTYRGFQALPEDPRNPKDDEFYGFLFQDSDFAKWIEAVGYSLATHPDPELEKTADEAIDLVCRAQTEDGYLDTYYIINGMDKVFSNLRDHHELYCLGHLIEGAVAYFQGTGKDKLLRAAMRFADYVEARFGTEEGKIHGYPGHEIAEMALLRLSEVTGEARYAKLAQYFIDQRGQAPLYFDMEHPQAPGEPYKVDYYHQAHVPVREQSEAVGHAVRAVYLYSGMADMARRTGDAALLAACRNLWRSIVSEKMYITGGIGATHLGEAFSFPFDLPNDTAYAETCASIGLVFFARRMLQIEARREYADVMELALYNGILSGIALDGKSFFYVNPLEVLPEACRLDERKMHVKPVRQKWFGCACCPPNLARLVASIGTYAYTENEETLFVHLYMGSSLRKNDREISVESSLPGSGRVVVRVGACDGGAASVAESDRAEAASGREDACGAARPLVLALRIPSWCEDKYEVLCQVQGERVSGLGEVRDGYLYVTVPDEETVIELLFEMRAKFVVADRKVTEDLGKAAVVRGPVVYCAEEADNGRGLGELYVDTEYEPEVTGESAFAKEECAASLDVRGWRIVPEEKGAGFAGGLYRTWSGARREACVIRMIPYRLWANRGEGEMRVYLNRG